MRSPGMSWNACHARARKLCPPGSCERCGKPEATGVHHRNHDWSDNRPENLERICRSCHIREHHVQRMCRVEGCDRPYKGGGYCNRHYLRAWKYGDPLIAEKPGGRKWGGNKWATR